jgi:hypothetical protein
MAVEFDQEARVTRALREVADYTWAPLDPGEWVCESPAGNAYLVSEESCTCEDWLYRASPCGGRCKHQVALGHKLLAEGRDLAEIAAERRRQEWAAQMAAEREEIRQRTAWVSDELLARVFR